MRIRKFFLLCSVIVLAGLQGIAQPEAGQLVASGNIKLQDKNYEGALADFNNALSKESGNKEALTGKINVLYSMGSYKDGIDVADIAITKYPKDANYYYLRGLLFNAREKYEKALPDFDKAYKLDTAVNAFSVLVNRAFAYQKIQEYRAAIKDLTAAIKKEPLNPIGWHTRGMVYYESENYEDALGDFMKAIELNDNNHIAYFNLGMTYYKLNDKANACTYFHKACRLNNSSNACKMILILCSE